MKDPTTKYVETENASDTGPTLPVQSLCRAVRQGAPGATKKFAAADIQAENGYVNRMPLVHSRDWN